MLLPKFRGPSGPATRPEQIGRADFSQNARSATRDFLVGQRSYRSRIGGIESRERRRREFGAPAMSCRTFARAHANMARPPRSTINFEEPGTSYRRAPKTTSRSRYRRFESNAVRQPIEL